MRWFEWGSVLQASLHKHFHVQISIWWNHQASCFHEYGNKKMSWLNCNTVLSSLPGSWGKKNKYREQLQSACQHVKDQH